MSQARFFFNMNQKKRKRLIVFMPNAIRESHYILSLVTHFSVAPGSCVMKQLSIPFLYPNLTFFLYKFPFMNRKLTFIICHNFITILFPKAYLFLLPIYSTVLTLTLPPISHERHSQEPRVVCHHFLTSSWET